MTPLHALKLKRSYKRHSRLFREGEPCKGTFVVLNGTVALSTGNASGQRIHLRCAGAGSVIGLSETVGGSAYQTTAIAHTNVTVHFIPTQDVLSLISDDPATGMQIVQMLVGDLTRVYGRIKRIASDVGGFRSAAVVNKDSRQ
jgi:CRP-like cAMP-binding protein